jgi:hypothetical protein
VRLLSLLVLALCLLLPVLARAERERAQIILVGPVRDASELRAVIAELLRRDGVSPDFVVAETFAADTLLAEPDADGRVHVYVTLPAPELARLYLRGPFGRRFLLRDLALRAGLDELGRESIAQVIASAAQALLRSGAGLDREAVRADLARADEPIPAAAPAPAVAAAAPPKPAAAPPAISVHVELSARGSAAWSGAALGARLGGGAELGVSQHWVRAPILRERLVFEQFAAQRLDTDELEAKVRYSALRLGLDLGGARGPHALFGGLGAGVDLVSVDPEQALDASWTPSKQHLDVLPMLRAELRYERLFSALLLSFSAYADVVLGDNRFKLQDGATSRSVAHPWHVLPGLSLGLGWRAK